MSRDLRELALLLVTGVVLGLGHLALRTDMPWLPAPRVEETACTMEGPGPAAAPASSAPAASFSPAEPMSSPGPEAVP